MKLRVLFLFIVGVFSLTSAFADEAPRNLILRVSGSNRSLLKTRIERAAQAVGRNGKLILDFTTSDLRSDTLFPGEETLQVPPQELLAGIPNNIKRRIYLVNSREAYGWPRDTSYGWAKRSDGKWQLYGRDIGNAMGGRPGTPGSYTSYSSLGIAALLMACRGDDFAFPHFEKESLQGGEIINNGEGTCAVNLEFSGEENRSLLSSMGCKKIIAGNSYEKWRKLGHVNGHIDLSAMFVGPRTVMIPSVSANCKSAFSEEWKAIEKTLKEQNIDTIEVPLAGGCDVRDPKIPEGQVGSLYVRSYSNGDILEDSIIIPEFVGFDADNARAKAILEQAMTDGKIPRKKVISIPSPEGGGEIRCLSLEVPGEIDNCSQDLLDNAIGKQLAQAQAIAKSGDCSAVQPTINTVRFLQNEPARERSLTLPGGRTLRISKKFESSLTTTAADLELVKAKCLTQPKTGQSQRTGSVR